MLETDYLEQNNTNNKKIGYKKIRSVYSDLIFLTNALIYYIFGIEYKGA